MYSFIGRGGIIWDRGGNFSKFIDRGSHREYLTVGQGVFRMDLFLAAHRSEVGKKVPIPKICRTCPTMMKLGTIIIYLKKIQNLYKSRDVTPLDFC